MSEEDGNASEEDGNGCKGILYGCLFSIPVLFVLYALVWLVSLVVKVNR